MKRTAAKNFVVRFWNFAINKNFQLIYEEIAAAVAARNDVNTKILLADCFKTFCEWPEDWTISSVILCHLYVGHHSVVKKDIEKW